MRIVFLLECLVNLAQLLALVGGRAVWILSQWHAVPFRGGKHSGKCANFLEEAAAAATAAAAAAAGMYPPVQMGHLVSKQAGGGPENALLVPGFVVRRAWDRHF